MNKTKKRLVAAVMGLAMIAGAAGLVAATTVEVTATPAMIQAYADYGVDADALLKESDDLSAAERKALQDIYDDADARGAVNGTVLSELWDFVEDDQTIATVKLAGRVYRVGMPAAFE